MSAPAAVLPPARLQWLELIGSTDHKRLARRTIFAALAHTSSKPGVLTSALTMTLPGMPA